ncbi:MAG: hypothetical protein PHC62_00735 [Candidatus Izemoplasmatales bacterium]|nr:hypothetical protein [Candidatus Izemoplasmatales bacterium]
MALLSISRRVKTTRKAYLTEGSSGSSRYLSSVPERTELIATMYDDVAQTYKTTYNSQTGWIAKSSTTIINSSSSSAGNASVTTVAGGGTSTSGSSTTAEQILGSYTGTLDDAERQAMYEEYNKYFDNYNFSNANGVLLKNMNGIIGMPYQFNALADPKAEGSVFGLKYMERIVSRSPIMLMSPGKVDFMPDAKKSEAVGIVSALADQKYGIKDDLSNVLSTNGRYYTFAFDYVEYYKYVNEMAAAGAVFLGIDDVVINMNGKKNKAGNFKWEESLGTDFGSYMSAAECVAFYVDSVNQVQDSFTNSTTESQLASKVNSWSEVGREIAFMLGTQSGRDFDLFTQDNIDQLNSQVEELANKYLKGNKIFADLGKNFSTVATGGKLIFPEIWDDSTFTRSFDISIKLRTPDRDPLSWYLNIYIPLCFLIALAAPHQHMQMGYYSPFLIRANYKGLFNVDMGIITDMSISKGAEGAWTIDGLPAVVDVNITLKDLYQAVLTMSQETNWFMSNITLMDYMANMCGININKPDVIRAFEIYAILNKRKILNIPNKIGRTMEEAMSNFLLKSYTNLTKWLP